MNARQVGPILLGAGPNPSFNRMAPDSRGSNEDPELLQFSPDPQIPPPGILFGKTVDEVAYVWCGLPCVRFR